MRTAISPLFRRSHELPPCAEYTCGGDTADPRHPARYADGMLRTLFVAVVLAACTSTLADVPAKGVVVPSASPTDQRVLDLLAEDFEAQKRRDPTFASRRGDRRFDALMPDMSSAARESALAEDAQRLAKVADLLKDPALSQAARLNAALLARELSVRIESDKFRTWQTPITQQSGPQTALPQLPDFLSFTADEHIESYAQRLEAVPAYLDQIIENMRAGLKDGRTPPRVVMGTVARTAGAMAGEQYLKDPASHPMFKPFIGRAEPLAERGRKAIIERVVPAFARFAEFLENEYVPGCRESIAARDLPDGEAYYNFCIKLMTTMDLTARQIHDIGLREVARIRAEMFTVIARSDFPGKAELQGDPLFAAFVDYLRTDKRFYHESAESLLSGYREIAKRIDPELPRFFGRLPRLPYGVREMPRFMSAAAPTAYYYPGSLELGVPGWFIANVYLLDQRPRYEMIPLTLHEACPGHHLQIAIAQELKMEGLPEWRETADYTVFVEGWALYAERLGLEMGDDPRSAANPSGKGMFTDPYDDFGRLTYEMWRAMRLVVDTGMHALGWPRDRAIQYMLDNSALSKANIEREVDRYIAWPGQALGYKLGELRIRDLRAEAEAELGDKFDIRAFHDVVLGQGAVPMDILTQQVRQWVTSRK